MRKLINQPFYIRCLMALALMLMPIGVCAQGSANLRWGNPNNAASFVEVSEWSINWSARSGAYPQLSNPNQVEVTYSSSNTGVATINASGVITPVAPGSTTITASFAGDQNFTESSASYALTYVDDRTEPVYPLFGFDSDSGTGTYGGTATSPGLNSGQLGQNPTITFSSSDTSVATVDANGITIVGAGTTVITASFAGSDEYKPATSSFTLTISPKEVTVDGFLASSKTYDGSTAATLSGGTVNGLVGSDAVTTSATGAFSDSNVGTGKTVTISGITLGGTSAANYKLAASGNQSSTTADITALEAVLNWNNTSFTYDGQPHVPAATVSNLIGSDACTVTVTGEQTNAGSYTATASALSNNNYKLPADNTKAFTISKADATVSFASKTADAKMGESFTAPTATTTPAGLSLTYSSSATSVATVDASTGAVTLVADGSTKITATFAGNDNYNAASDSYTLTVAKVDAVSPDLSFSAATATATYGDASVSTPALSNPQQLPLTWSSSKEDVATVNASGVVTIVGAGETVISAAFAGNDTYTAKTISYTLTVNKVQPMLSFSTMSVTAKLGEDFVPPTLTTTPKGLEPVYSSTNESVATVDAQTGKVTLLAAGTTKIKAVFTATQNYHYASTYYDLTVKADDSLLVPIVEEKDYTMDEKLFVNPDGSEVDLTNNVINNILFTLKNTASPEGDGYDTEGHSIVINTVTGPAVVDDILADGTEPGSSEYAKRFTGMTFMVPAGTGEIVVNSQEANGYHLMVKVGSRQPVSIYQTERVDYSIPYESDHPTYVYVYNGGTDVVSGSTRGKKSAINVRVYKVSYKAKGSSGIEQIYIEPLDDDCWYDLNGQRIAPPVKKGIYINGHRKVVIR